MSLNSSYVSARLSATLALAMFLILATPLAGSAQVLYGSITGNVTDSAGAAVPGATVTVTHKQTGQSREGVTDANGGYDFPTVLAGLYSVRIGKSGFKTMTKDDVAVTLNTITRADVSVEVGQVTETVVVTAETTQIKTDRAEVSAELTSKPLQNLPVPLGRNYQNLFKTLPGITPPENAHSIPSNPSRSLVFNVNGSSRSSNNTRIDGASSTNLWLPHITAYVPALESIETVNVVTNSFDAEQGLAGGAAINVQIKSGANDFHGSAFEYHNNHRLNARNFFYPLNPDNSLRNRAKLINNQYGGTIGGPIVRNKLFFFGSWEGTKDRQNAARANLNVPIAQIRNGDFRGLRNSAGNQIEIYDPLTGNANGTGRQIISCNGVLHTICANRIHPAVTKILGLVPAANQGTAEQRNYFTSAPFLFDRDTVDAKINYTVTDKFNMFGRYSILHFSTFNEATFGPKLQGAPINGGNPGNGSGNTHSFSVGGVYTLSQNLIFDANFGFVRMGTGVAHTDIGEKVGQTFLGIPGTNGDKDYEGGFPLFDVAGFERYGVTETYMPYYRSDDQFQYVANLNWLKGAHNVRVGLDLYFQRLNHTQPEFLGSSLGARGGFV
ncbi:MAG: carboxypeptidase regulatory-like domain-containing protein, partial [Blastocatellia bacterium]